MISKAIEKIGKSLLKADSFAKDILIGSLIDVHVRVSEGGKDRIQLFTGIVIARKGHGSTETFTVRRVSHGVGVERVFPIHSPQVVKIVPVKLGRVRRAKLYYLRELAGKKARIKEFAYTEQV